MIEINENESIYLIKQKLDQAILNLKKTNYDTILNFMNDLLSVHNKSLLNFQNINFEKIQKSHIDNVVIKYNIIIPKNKDIITTISKMLKSIGYFLYKKKNEFNIYCINIIS